MATLCSHLMRRASAPLRAIALAAALLLTLSGPFPVAADSAPSTFPTWAPTLPIAPSQAPSEFPSVSPSLPPTSTDAPSARPYSQRPSSAYPTLVPSAAPVPLSESPTQLPSSISPTSESPSSASPSSASPSSMAPTSESPTSLSPSTESPTSNSPTSFSPTSHSPSSYSPTSSSPSTEIPTSASPTSSAPTSASPSSESPSSLNPVSSSLAPSTSALPVASPTAQPTSLRPTSTAPQTSRPTTKPAPTKPTTRSPSTTSAPSTTLRPSRSPVLSTPSPTTESPTSLRPTSHAPTSATPSNKATRSPSTTAIPTTTLRPSLSPVLSTPSPTTGSPTSLRPTSHAPTTGNPSSVSPTNRPSSRSPSLRPGTTSSPSLRPTLPTNLPSSSPFATPTTSPLGSSPTTAPSYIAPSFTAPSQSPTPPTTLQPTTSQAPSTPTTEAPTTKPTLPTAQPSTSPTPPATRYNVLLLIADDFKPLTQEYGSPLVKYSGALDRLSSMGVTFMNAHTQMAFCAPSRASFLTSLRPDTLRVYELQANQLNQALMKWPSYGPTGVATLPQIFKQQGYVTYGIGKIFHENEFALMQSPNVWTTPVYTWLSNYARPPSFTTPYQGGWINFPTAPDSAFTDGQAAALAVGLVKSLTADASQPFFLAVGLWKPHLPWRCPAQYLDTETSFNPSFAGGIPGGLSQAEYLLARGNGCGEVNLYAGAPSSLDASSAPSSTCAVGNQAYHATAHYMDTQMGKILDALLMSEAANTTHIVFLGDHGFHLGDHGLYCKHTNYQQATRSPLIVVPALSLSGFARGQKAWAPVELLDIIPTTVDLAKFIGGVSSATGSAIWEGTSLVPMLKNPLTYVKASANAQYFRGSGSSVKMGYTARSVRYRTTQWCPWSGSLSGRRRRLSSAAGCFSETYDYVADPFEQHSVGGPNPAFPGMLRLLKYPDAQKGVVPFDWVYLPTVTTSCAKQTFS